MASDLEAAADLIQGYGLAKFVRFSKEGYCVIGALAQIAWGNPDFTGSPGKGGPFARLVASLSLSEFMFTSTNYAESWALANWANASTTTKEDVVQALRRTAIQWRQEDTSA